jgi:outer membrane protein assembly factor BamB
MGSPLFLLLFPPLPFLNTMFRRDEKKSLDNDNTSLESQELRPFSRNQVIICATHGKLYAVHKKDGSRLWRQSFPTAVFGGVVSIFVTDDDTVLVGVSGKTACLNLFTGVFKWVNTMKVSVLC